MLYKLRVPLTSDELQVSSIASRNVLRFTWLSGAILEGLGTILGHLGRAKWEPNSISGSFFLSSFRKRFWMDCWEIIKSICFFNGFCYFSQNQRFQKRGESNLILAPFSEAKATKNLEKTCWKKCCFWTSNFKRFFLGFLRFWLDFGRSRASQQLQKKTNSIALGTHLGRTVCSMFALERFWEGFWEAFETIFKIFWQEVGVNLVPNVLQKLLFWETPAWSI